MKKIIIDCDPGLDDAVALLAAFGARDVEVLALTTVAGNVKGPQTVYNAQVIREVAGQGAGVGGGGWAGVHAAPETSLTYANVGSYNRLGGFSRSQGRGRG